MNQLKIPKIPETSQMTIRFPNDLIDEIKKVIQEKQISFNRFIVLATVYALKELKDDKN